MHVFAMASWTQWNFEIFHIQGCAVMGVSVLLPYSIIKKSINLCIELNQRAVRSQLTNDCCPVTNLPPQKVPKSHKCLLLMIMAVTKEKNAGQS